MRLGKKRKEKRKKGDVVLLLERKGQGKGEDSLESMERKEELSWIRSR